MLRLQKFTPYGSSLSRFPAYAAAFLLAVAMMVCVPASGAAQQYRYTAHGDSIAFGLWAPWGQGYVYQYQQQLADVSQASIQIFPMGVPGWTSADLLYALRYRFLYRITTFSSQVITVNIGGNDLSAARSSYKNETCGGEQCLEDAVAEFKSNWDGILQEIRRLRAWRPTVIRTMDIYNPYVDEDSLAGDFDTLNAYLQEVNAYIYQTATANGILVAPVYEAFNMNGGQIVDPASKGYLAFDGYHPNRAGHTKIAELLGGLGYAATVPVP